MERPGFFAVLPASVRYDARLSASEKIFFAEITSLTEDEGYCYASNAYFCQLYGAGERTVQRWLKDLQAAGYIRIEPAAAGEDARPRRIFMAGGAVRGADVAAVAERVPKMAPGGAKNGGEGVPKMAPPTSKNNKDITYTCARVRAKEPVEVPSGRAEGPLPVSVPEASQEREVREVFERFTDDGRLLAALKDFAEHRKAKKKPLTKLAARRLVSKLQGLASDADARDPRDYMRAALDESILNGWTDVYAVKEYRPSPPPAVPGSGTDHPRVIRAGVDAADLF